MKKWITILLTLAMLFSLAVPALAVESEDDGGAWTEYDRGWNEGWTGGYNDGYEKGKADFAANAPATPYDGAEDHEYTFGDTYEDGRADAYADGYYNGYIDGYNQEYYDGYSNGYDQGQKAGYEAGKAAGQAKRPEDVPYGEDTGDTYEDGRAEGWQDGYADGYWDGYYEATGRYVENDLAILDKGGALGQINVMYQGECIPFDVAPEVKNQRAMVPVRAVMESMGATVEYGKEDNSVTITLNGTVVTFTIGSDTYTVTKDGVTTTEKMDTATYATHSRTMVPIRFLSEASGYTVLWDQAYKTAVILDRDGLAAEIDSKFTALNTVLAARMKEQAGKKLQQSDTFSGKFTYYDETGKATVCPVSGTVTAYTDGTASRIDLSVNMKDALMALVKNDPSLLSQIHIDLPTALTVDLSNITATIILDHQGQLCLNCPLFNSVMDKRSDGWLCQGYIGELYGETGPDQMTIGRILVTSVAKDELAFDLNEILDVAVASMESMLGDKVVKQSGNSYTWTMDLKSLLADTGLLDEEDLTELDDALSFTATIQMDTAGRYDMKADLKLDMDPFSVVTGSLRASGNAKGGKLTLKAAMADLFDLEVNLTETIKEVKTLPALDLPAGAVIID